MPENISSRITDISYGDVKDILDVGLEIINKYGGNVSMHKDEYENNVYVHQRPDRGCELFDNCENAWNDFIKLTETYDI